MMGQVPDGMPVDVYWNLHKRCFSVRSRSRDSYGRVIAHAQSVNLRSVSFIVSAQGRSRVLSEKRKNVHAFMRGVWSCEVASCEIPITYNPYNSGTFMSGTVSVSSASAVYGWVDKNQPIVRASTFDSHN